MMRVLAENARTASKATIKRASARARIDMNRLDARVLDDLDALYRRAAFNLRADIQGYAASDGSLRLEVLQSLLDQVNARLSELARVRDQLLDGQLLEAARLGVRPFEGAVTVVGDLNRVANEAVLFVRSFQAADGLQLSDRLWRIDQGARQQLGQLIQTAVIQGHSASRAASDFLARGQGLPPETVRQISQAQASGVAQQVGAALLRDEGNARDKVMRVFRTELNRAHGEAYQAAAFSHPDVIGTRFLLSPRHPEADICDMHASVNRYGLGKGVYPQGRNPWPAHPNTLSYTEVVFADEVSDTDRAGQEDRLSWLNRQSPPVQAAVLGAAQKRAAFTAGILTETQIATPWKILRRRYQEQGVDIDALHALPIEPLPILPSARIPAELGPSAAPVSQALQIQAQKAVSARVLAAIDGVHRDGKLPTIPITGVSSRAGYYGAYVFTRSGRPVKIALRAGGDHKDLTLAHEIGHFLDHAGVPGAGFASERSPLFDAWRHAVAQTRAVRTLRTLRDGPLTLTLADGSPYRVNRAYLDYLLGYDELWARSYAQWITQESGDPILTQQLDEIVATDLSSPIGYGRQWERDDFEPIAAAIRAIMRTLKWQ